MANNQPLLSVVIPISAMSGKLDRMKSWLGNVDLNLCEIVLVHDRRDDATQRELEDLTSAIDHQNFKLFSGNWANPGGPRNEGIFRSSGNWIAFWDCDDTPNVGNVLKCLTKNHDTDVHVGGFQVVDADSEVVTKTFTTEKIDDLYMNPGLWRMIFRKDVIGETVFPELLMGEDQVFLMRLSIGSRQVNFHREIFYNYYSGNSSQLTRQARAIKDLKSSILETYNYFIATDTAERRLVGVMLIKQYLGLMKRDPFLGILKPSWLTLLAFQKSPIIIIQSFTKVMKNTAGR
jgi:glycosyltransferase involved in cell wall biosynthesis